MNFNQLQSATTGELFDTYISEDNQLMIQRSTNNLYELLPNTNKAKMVNRFYTIFSSKITDTVEDVKQQAQRYYK